MRTTTRHRMVYENYMRTAYNSWAKAVEEDDAGTYDHGNFLEVKLFLIKATQHYLRRVTIHESNNEAKQNQLKEIEEMLNAVQEHKDIVEVLEKIEDYSLQ